MRAPRLMRPILAQMLSFESWQDTMWSMVDAEGLASGWYFAALTIIGAFLLLNAFIAGIASVFMTLRRENQVQHLHAQPASSHVTLCMAGAGPDQQLSCVLLCAGCCVTAVRCDIAGLQARSTGLCLCHLDKPAQPELLCALRRPVEFAATLLDGWDLIQSEPLVHQAALRTGLWLADAGQGEPAAHKQAQSLSSPYQPDQQQSGAAQTAGLGLFQRGHGGQQQPGTPRGIPQQGARTPGESPCLPTPLHQGMGPHASAERPATIQCSCNFMPKP